MTPEKVNWSVGYCCYEERRSLTSAVIVGCSESFRVVGREAVEKMSISFEINDVSEEVNAEIAAAFPADPVRYVQAGSEKYLLTSKYRDQAAGIYNFELRSDDVWVVTFPRSGTTWTQELVWLINNDLDYERALNEKLSERFPFIEASILLPDEFAEDIAKLNGISPVEFGNSFTHYEKVSKMQSPRHIKTHLPPSLLPPELLDTCKVIYVARNPKDVAVSCYYQNSYLRFIGFQGNFDKYWDLFQRGLVLYAPFWSHVEEAWRMRNHKNMLFIFYEELKKDLPAVLRKVAAFLNKELKEEQIKKLVDHLKIENFKKNPSMIDRKSIKGMVNEEMPGFFRQGKSGSWRSEFKPELNDKADKWIKKHEMNTDLRFQY